MTDTDARPDTVGPDDLAECLGNLCAFAKRQQRIVARFSSDKPTEWDKAHRLTDTPWLCRWGCGYTRTRWLTSLGGMRLGVRGARSPDATTTCWPMSIAWLPEQGGPVCSAQAEAASGSRLRRAPRPTAR